jgi:hypothetical protein
MNWLQLCPHHRPASTTGVCGAGKAASNPMPNKSAAISIEIFLRRFTVISFCVQVCEYFLTDIRPVTLMTGLSFRPNSLSV